MRICTCVRNLWCTWVVILCFTNGIACMRTAPPDDIIAIIESGEYNRHHLPTYATANTSLKSQKTLRGSNDWILIMEHYHKAEYDRIRMIHKEMPSGRTIRIELSRAVAKQLVHQLTRFINHYTGKSAGNKHGASSGQNKTHPNSVDYSYSAEKTQKDDSLLSAEIRIDPLRVYYVNFVRKSNGNEALLITEAKGRTRRSTILIPSNYWQNVTEVLEEFVETKYRMLQGPPTNVTISLYIEGMSSFRAQTMDFHVDIYFSETWIDPRLQHSNNYPALLRDMTLFEQMWHPDLYFANAKDAKYHSVTAANFLVYVYPNGSIYLDIRISLVLNCMMDLSHYPLDQQECFIRILSYAYDRDNLNIIWKDFENITINSEIKLPDMNLVNYEAQYCDGTYAIGIWACARASFKMKREIMHHVLQSYIPTALIVVISWFSFWLDVDAVPGRVSLCITTLLTLATQAQAAKMSLPQVSYAKAIDVWMGTCMGFVFGVMIEFTVVNYISRRTTKAVADSPSTAQATALNKKRCSTSSSRLLTHHPLTTAATTPTVPARRLSEFHNLLFEVTAIGPEDPRCQSTHDCDSTAVGVVCHQPYGKESNGFMRHASLTHRQSCLSTANTNLNVDGEPMPIPLNKQSPVQQQQAQRNRKLAVTVDRVSRFIFPCSFILFNMLYWPYYLLPRM